MKAIDRQPASRSQRRDGALARLIAGVVIGACALAAGGCGHVWSRPAAEVSLTPIAQANPILVPVADSEYVWTQIVDTVDDYFKIQHEERVRVIGGVLTAGRIDTFPVVGATLLEPWRRDSTRGFERLHSTLQSVRRRAVIHVIPVGPGFSIEAIVLKDLEDLNHPENAAVGSTTPARHDGTLRQERSEEVHGPVTLGWIPQGRDLSLERELLRQIQGRLAEAPASPTL